MAATGSMVIKGMEGLKRVGRLASSTLLTILIILAASGARCLGDPGRSQHHLGSSGVGGRAGEERAGRRSRGGGWRRERGGGGHRGDGDDDHHSGVRFWEESLAGVKSQSIEEVINAGFRDEKERQEKEREGARKAKEMREETQREEAEEARRTSGLGRYRRATAVRDGSGREGGAFPQRKHDRDFRARERKGMGVRGGARGGVVVGVAPRVWDTVTEEANQAAKMAADTAREEARRKAMHEVVDEKGTTREQMIKWREGVMRPRIDPSDPFAPTRKWANRQELDALMPDGGDDRVICVHLNPLSPLPYPLSPLILSISLPPQSAPLASET